MVNQKVGLQIEQAIRAAERCFIKYGVHRASMNDVAEELGVARQTVYRVLGNRTQLLEYVATRRMRKLSKREKIEFVKYKDLEVALVEGSMFCLDIAKSDSLLYELIRSNDDIGFEKFLFQGSPEVQRQMLDTWGDLLDDARSSGKLHDYITNDKAVQWIRNIHALLTIRNDYSEDDRREILADYLVPSLIYRTSKSK